MKLTTLIRKLFPRTYQRIITQGTFQAHTQTHTNRRATYKLERERMHNNYVVHVSGDGEVRVGFVYDWLEKDETSCSTIPMIECVLTGFRFIGFGIVRTYHPALLGAVNKIGGLAAYQLMASFPNWDQVQKSDAQAYKRENIIQAAQQLTEQENDALALL